MTAEVWEISNMYLYLAHILVFHALEFVSFLYTKRIEFENFQNLRHRPDQLLGTF